MLHLRWSSLTLGRVNPLVPAAVVVAGLILTATGSAWIGAGVVLGALLAFANGLFLSRRIDVAADLANIGQALLVMQLGLVVTCTVVGLITIVLIHFSLPLAIACAAGFAATQLALLATFYLSAARTSTPRTDA